MRFQFKVENLIQYNSRWALYYTSKGEYITMILFVLLLLQLTVAKIQLNNEDILPLSYTFILYQYYVMCIKVWCYHYYGAWKWTDIYCTGKDDWNFSSLGTLV